jgi:hypothetical protein
VNYQLCKEFNVTVTIKYIHKQPGTGEIVLILLLLSVEGIDPKSTSGLLEGDMGG